MTAKSKKNARKPKRAPLRTTVYVLVAALVVVTVFFVGRNLLDGITIQTGQTTGSTQDPSSQTTAGGTIQPGVSINGVDVSGMTRDEALAATAQVPASVLAKVMITIKIDGEMTSYNAQDLGITTNYDEIVQQALDYRSEATQAGSQSTGSDATSAVFPLTVRPVAVKDAIAAALLPLQERTAIAAADATVIFMPWGFTADGKAYQPDPKKLADAQSRGKNLDRPELVRFSAAEMPSILRYKYWSSASKYLKDYVPADANIARFRYTSETEGRLLDVGGLASQIVAAVDQGEHAIIEAAFQTVDPAVTVADLKNRTQLISSWSSSYHNHANANRNWNVSRMSSFINGTVILPGERWSVNETAGPRDEKTALTIGWKLAAGILAGGYTDQEGGGVCQLGSTTFNAAKRSGITIVSATHHTIPSDYIPLGLDATLSTPAPDLVLRNDGAQPVYIISYVNPKDENVTVEVYGELPVDPKYGSVIYDFTSDNRGTRYGEATMRFVYNATTTPDEKVILSEINPVFEYAKMRYGIEIQTYKHIYDLNGQELCDPIADEFHKYPVINGTTYVFGPDPATVTPTPTPTITPTITPSPTTSPTTETAPTETP
jgi:vancomycin resistance protein YoaR